MSLKQEIETWVAALGRYDNNEFDEALKEFDGIADTSKILFNMGVIHATLGEHEKAVECYQRAIRLDQYLAVAYFQQGVSNFLLGDFEEALANFNDTLLYLRGNTMIDYAQLGLLFKLYSCEVLFNRGLCYIYLQQKDAGLQDLQYAVKEKVVEDHNVIDEAIREEAEGYTVFSIPVGVVYRPNDAKVRNLKTKDYLGKARLVAASDRANAFTGFAGSEIKNAGKASVKDDRPSDNISFAATNLVKPGLQSRMPVPPGGGGGGGANFPPTPPPRERQASSHEPWCFFRNNSYTRASPQDDRRGPSRAPSRAASVATRSPPNRGYSQRDTRSRAPRDDDGYPDDVYDMYDGGGDPRSSTSTRRRGNNNRYEDEPEGSDYDSFDEGEFEMIPQRRPTNSMSGSSRGGSRRPDIRKIRIKVHSEDVRYIMVGAAVEFADLQDRIREKFGLRRRFKLRVRDEDSSNPSDMITMGDQDDLDIAMMSAKSLARKQKQDVGKMEIWIQEI
ncbi:tetratricopeptide [Apiospora saccharicola]